MTFEGVGVLSLHEQGDSFVRCLLPAQYRQQRWRHAVQTQTRPARERQRHRRLISQVDDPLEELKVMVLLFDERPTCAAAQLPDAPMVASCLRHMKTRRPRKHKEALGEIAIDICLALDLIVGIRLAAIPVRILTPEYRKLPLVTPIEILRVPRDGVKFVVARVAKA